MGYVANYSAKKLREGKSYTIALIIDDLRSYIFSTIADEIIVYAAENCTAIICYDDNIALEAASCLDETGRSVPEDISLTGFGNIQKNMFFMPMLTTVDSVDKKISISAVDALIDKINGNNPQKMILPVTLIERKSVLRRW